MKRIPALFCSLLLFLSFFSSCASATEYQKHQHYFFDTFDTVITLIAYTQSDEEFQQYAELAETQMRRYHQIFDQYHPYDGVHNLYAVNQSAGREPAKAEPELINLLFQIGQWHEAFNCTVTNPAMGSVLRLWHDAREDGVSVPEQAALKHAALYTDYQKVMIDQAAQTVSFADPEMSLDLGAVAKGYAAQLVADQLRAAGLHSFILNAGGNVVCGDAPLDGRAEWNVAIQAIDGVSSRLIIGAKNQAIVTSGDYQRYYVVNGKAYHHLIDPATLFPAEHMHAVSIVHPDSGLADFLSTAAFLLPYEESRALIESIPDAEGFWTLADGSEFWTEGFEALIRKINE